MAGRPLLGALLRGGRGGPGTRGLQGNLPRDPGARGLQGKPGARGLVAAGKLAAGLATAGVLVGNYMERFSDLNSCYYHHNRGNEPYCTHLR